jgi:hypothetical protein
VQYYQDILQRQTCESCSLRVPTESQEGGFSELKCHCVDLLLRASGVFFGCCLLFKWCFRLVMGHGNFMDFSGCCVSEVFSPACGVSVSSIVYGVFVP